MIYAYIIAVLAIFGAGFATSHTIDRAEIVTLQTAIVQSNMQAEQELQLAKAKVETSNAQAQQLNQQIEVSHAQAISTVNALSDRAANAAKRLYPVRHQDCSNPLPAGSDSTKSDATTADQISREIGGIAGEIKRLDAYGQACWQFVSANCGIVDHVK